jgi:hypothetical protein
MMRRQKICIMFVVLGIVAMVGAPNAETIVYELNEIVGEYPEIQPSGEPHFYRTQLVTYYGPTARVDGISVKLLGVAEMSQIACEVFPTVVDTVPNGVDTSTSVSVGDILDRWGEGGVVMEDGAFEVVRALRPWSTAFEYIHDGDVMRVSQTLGPTGFIAMCWYLAPLPWPEGRIELAELTIDLTPEISTEPTTWGSIKALYQSRRN